MKKEIFVTEEASGDRVDKFLSEQCEEYSRSFLQKLMKSGGVFADGRPVKASYRVSEGNRLTFEVPEAVEPEILAENIPLDILYEDRDVILVNKPKGMVVHPAAGHYTGTLVNALMYHCREDLSGINGVLRPGIVHRIDMDTTGVLIHCRPAEGAFHNQTVPGHCPWSGEGGRGCRRRPHWPPSPGQEKNVHQPPERQVCGDPLPGAEALFGLYPY